MYMQRKLANVGSKLSGIRTRQDYSHGKMENYGCWKSENFRLMRCSKGEKRWNSAPVILKPFFPAGEYLAIDRSFKVHLLDTRVINLRV